MAKWKTRYIVNPLPDDETRDEDYIDLDVTPMYSSTGVRYTNEMFEKEAEEIEKNPNYFGRPSLSGKQEISPEIKARVPQRLKDFAQQLADERGLTISNVVRAALFEYLERNGEFVHEVEETKPKRSKTSA